MPGSASTVGSIRAKMELDASGFNQGLQKAKQNMSDSAAEARRVNAGIRNLSKALSDTGVSAREVRKIQQELRNTKPELLEQQLRNVEVQLRKIGVSSDQIYLVKNRIREASGDFQAATKGVNGFGSALAVLGSGSALAGLLHTVKSLVDESQKMYMAQQGLIAMSKSLDIEIEKSTGLAQEFADKGFMSITESAKAVKLALGLGLGLDETRKLLIALGDAAAYNRQANYGWGEAIVTTIEGIKQGNSVLTDAVGVTTNLSVMYKRYADSIGTTEGKLTAAQKIQAAYNGFMSEASIYAGNAATAMQGYAGTQAHFNQTITIARAELGEAFIPILTNLMVMLTPIITSFAKWSEENPKLVVGLTAAAAAILALVTVVGALSVAFVALNAAMGPIGWIILGIGALVTGVAAYTVAANAASSAVSDFAKNQELLNQKLSESPIKLNADEYTKMQDNIKTLNEVLERRNTLQDEYDQRLAAAHGGQGSIENTHRLFELADAIKAVDKELKGMDFSSVEQAQFALTNMQQASQQATGALVELERQTLRETATNAANIRQMKAMIAEYEKLTANAKLTEQQKARLEQVVKSLKEQYPDLIAQLDSENQWHIKNKDSLLEYIRGEENRVKASGEASVKTLTIAKKEAEERVRLAKAALDQIRRLESGAQIPTASFIPDSVKNLMDLGFDSALKATKKNLNESINTDQFAINEASKVIRDVSTDNWDAFLNTGSGSSAGAGAGGGDKKKEKQGKTLAEIQQEQYQSSLKWIEYKKNLDQMSEKEELAALLGLQDRYKKNGEIRMDVEVKIHQLRQQMQKTSFSDSQEWITQEERRMTLAGKGEEQISQMKLDAWTRVRNRYQKDSELYKQADSQLYNTRIELVRMAEKAEKDAADDRAKRVKTSMDSAVNAIEKEKQAELDALDERRKQIEKFYDDQEKTIDNSERLKKRNELVAEMEKYRFATSEKGQKTFLDLQEQLRQMDVEDQKKNLQEQKNQELDTLDKRKQNIESWYDELKNLLDGYSGDAIGIYKMIEDERFKAFTQTNSKIRAELQALQQSYSSIMSGSTTASGSKDASAVARMQANSSAWKTASASQKKQLEAENSSLGSSIGATYKSSEGRWYKDGKPLYHSGGIAGVTSFQSADRLLPDELDAVLRIGEPVMTPQQIGSLVASVSGGGTPSSIVIEKFMEVNDPHFEDGIDLRTFGRETGDTAAAILRKKLTGGVGSD